MMHGPINIRVNSTPSGETRLETKLLMSQKLFAVVMTVTVILMEIYRTKSLSHYGRRVLGSHRTPTFIQPEIIFFFAIFSVPQRKPHDATLR